MTGVTRKRILVVAAVIRDGGHVLIARRPEHAHQGGLWEFPGGKVEPGEPELAALTRELEEELGLTPLDSQPLIRICHDYPDKSVELSVYEVTRFLGEHAVRGAFGREGQAIAWVPQAELRAHAFPAANVPIVAAAALPVCWCITPALDNPEAVLAWAVSRATAAATGEGWLLRLPGWSDADYLAVATQVLAVAAQAGVPLMLHGAPERLVALPGAAGLHLPAALAQACGVRPIASTHWLSVAAHTPGDIAHAAVLGADMALLSPLRETASHPGQPGLGWETWTAWVRPALLPVYALGGMTRDDIPAVRAAGGQGVAGIRGL